MLIMNSDIKYPQNKRIIIPFQKQYNVLYCVWPNIAANNRNYWKQVTRGRLGVIYSLNLLIFHTSLLLMCCCWEYRWLLIRPYTYVKTCIFIHLYDVLFPCGVVVSRVIITRQTNFEYVFEYIYKFCSHKQPIGPNKLSSISVCQFKFPILSENSYPTFINVHNQISPLILFIMYMISALHARQNVLKKSSTISISGIVFVFWPVQSSKFKMAACGHIENVS